MRSSIAIFRFELAKALRARATWVTLGLPPIVAALFVAWDQTSRRVQAASGGGVEAITSAYPSFSRGVGSGLALGGILLLLYSAMLIANEGNWRTFKTIMLRPHARIAWIGGKFALLLLLTFAMLASVAAAGYAAGRLTGEFGDIVEDGYVFFTAGALARETWFALGLALPPMIALAAFGMMISTMTDHAGAAASGCLGAYIVLETAKGSMPEGGRFLFNRFMPSLSDTSYFRELRGFAEGMSDAGWDRPEFLYNVATPLISALVFFGVAAIIFQRRSFLI